MSESWASLDLPGLAESCDLECKAAQGRDGRGEVSDDFWKSYSAMANVDGGLILLGVQEKPRGQFLAIGVHDVDRLRKALWDNLHNRKQVSVNLLSEQDIAPIEVDGKTVLRVKVPRAARQNKPVHVGANPFGGTYLRRYEGDYQADDEAVRRLLAERVEDSRDERVLKVYDFNDLDMESVAVYRNRFAAVRPGHVWSDLPVPEFLERIGAIGKNRDEGFAGLRLAGLLMFGQAEVIRDALPHYMVDYQERPEPKAERRWIDRLVPDGSWSGNVYDFFRKVYQKLTADLKVPFQLQDGQRVDDTPVHEALREALANTLIHADFSGRVSVLVVKRPDMFGFRNPGLMRVPPELYELRDPEQTLMELRTSSLVPEDALVDLQQHLGERFATLPELPRLALITASAEGLVHHSRLREISTEHPADITKMLAGLVRDGLLLPDGTGRGMVYFLPWQKQYAGSIFQRIAQAGDASVPAPVPPQLGAIPPQLGAIPPQLEPATPEQPGTYLDWAEVPPALQSLLIELASPISQRRRERVPPEMLRATIQSLCNGRYLGRRILAQLLARNPDDLLRRILNPMVEARLLEPAHSAGSDPRQAYLSRAADAPEIP